MMIPLNRSTLHLMCELKPAEFLLTEKRFLNSLLFQFCVWKGINHDYYIRILLYVISLYIIVKRRLSLSFFSFPKY